MFSSIRYKTALHLFPYIVLLGILIPMLLLANVKSITLYLTTVQLQNTIEEVLENASEYMHKLNERTSPRSSSQIYVPTNKSESGHPRTTLQTKPEHKAYNKTVVSSIKDERKPSTMPTSHITTGRPLSCQECFMPKFDFLLENNNICKMNRSSVELLILIASAPQHNIERDAIRETWLTHAKKNEGDVRYAFLLGQSPENIEIYKENNRTKDIILSNFKDAYSNLTLKTLMGFHWTLKFCKHAKFVMKTDDDMYINIPGLLKKVKMFGGALQKAVGGSCVLISNPIRSKNSKWYASVQSYPQKKYPGFCSGTGYVTSLNVVSKIVNISKYIPFFHLEDVYVSLCIQKLGYRLHPMDGFMNKKVFDPCFYRSDSLITAHQVPIKWIKYLWNTPCLKPSKNSTAIMNN